MINLSIPFRSTYQGIYLPTYLGMLIKMYGYYKESAYQRLGFRGFSLLGVCVHL